MGWGIAVRFFSLCLVVSFASVAPCGGCSCHCCVSLFVLSVSCFFCCIDPVLFSVVGFVFMWLFLWLVGRGCGLSNYKHVFILIFKYDILPGRCSPIPHIWSVVIPQIWLFSYLILGMTSLFLFCSVAHAGCPLWVSGFHGSYCLG